MAQPEHIISCSHRSSGHFGEAMEWSTKKQPRWFIVDNFFKGKEAYDEAREENQHGATLWVEAGENLKSLGSVERALQWLTDQGANRSDGIAVIGGGTVLDFGLFVAAIFQRGMKAWCIPTTLLAAVDAGIGGKNGVNFQGLKNYVGTITQPEVIVTDLNALNTLPALHVMNGWMEMAKHGLIAAPDLWAQMSAFAAIPTPANMHDMIVKAADVKKQIIYRDANELGERKTLNFGHTLAHALESRAASLGRELPHGIAVGIGLVFSLHWSAQRCLDESNRSEMERAASIVRDWLLGSAEETLAQTLRDFDAETTWSWMQKDKKNEGNSVLEIALNKLGRAAWGIPMSRRDFDAAWSLSFGQ